ncbi:helix-turn-helix domain-containing protein [Nocardiopsis dassonvillei]
MPHLSPTGPSFQPHRTTAQAPQAPTPPPWVGYCTLAQACARLGISRDQVLTWERQGLVRCVRDARGHRRVRVADLDALADHHPGPLLPPAQAALVVGVQVEYLTRMARRGLVACVVLPSGQRRYCPDELQHLAARRSTSPKRARHTPQAPLSPATMRELTRPVPGLASAPGARVTPREATR